MQGLVVKLAETPEERSDCREVRRRVFILEQGIAEDEEYDDLDAMAVHAVALVHGRVVGTGRLVKDGHDVARIGRMAVDEAVRRHGVGGEVLALLEWVARAEGYPSVHLHAQTYVQKFYAAQGYEPAGDLFVEAGIEHVLMTKQL